HGAKAPDPAQAAGAVSAAAVQNPAVLSALSGDAPMAALSEAAQAAGVMFPRMRAKSAMPADAAGALERVASSGRSKSAHVQAFTDKLAGYAEQASQATGIPAKFMLGQAALESGWGRRQIVGADGKPSNNLFGIKAGPGWKGKVTEALTTEFVNGVPVTKREKFRAYDTPADSFADYARLLRSNPRYENVLANSSDAASFARGLQRAGYATDPQYAAKLTRIIKNTLS
ncbi:MAG TPA: flagellar assembly peptidoglycan hydrolase FlgJ, partial [Burkholderiaceae bacterium]